MATHLTVRAAGPITRHHQIDGTSPDFIDSLAVQCDDGLVLEIELDDDVFIDQLADALIDLLELRRRRSNPPLAILGQGDFAKEIRE